MKYEFDRDKFRVRLLATGQTQSEFGFKVGKSQAAISAYVLGRGKPSRKCIAEMASALHCEIEDLLEGGGRRKAFRISEAHLYGRSKRSDGVRITYDRNRAYQNSQRHAG